MTCASRAGAACRGREPCQIPPGAALWSVELRDRAEGSVTARRSCGWPALIGRSGSRIHRIPAIPPPWAES